MVSSHERQNECERQERYAPEKQFLQAIDAPRDTPNQVPSFVFDVELETFFFLVAKLTGTGITGNFYFMCHRAKYGIYSHENQARGGVT